MPLATLKTVLELADARKAACLGFVCQGWEDARAYTAAGEAVGAPVILLPDGRAREYARASGEMFQSWRPVPGASGGAPRPRSAAGRCEAALEAGFSSVMIDGSALPLEENIALTRAVTAAAQARGVSVEAEVGTVGYQGGAPSEGTTLDEARIFAAETDVDALAISVGNLHLQTEDHAVIDWDRLAEIGGVTACPLVLHGGSGIRAEDRRRLARDHRVNSTLHRTAPALAGRSGRNLRPIRRCSTAVKSSPGPSQPCRPWPRNCCGGAGPVPDTGP